MMQGVTWELDAETEEWALRWRTGRLLDLGFPDEDEALSLYAILPARSVGELPERAATAEELTWRLPIWMPRLPVSSSSHHSLLRALAALGEDERKTLLFALLNVANRVAVAKRLSLGDADSIPIALDEAIATVSRGLDHLVAAHGVAATEVLRRASLERLFRVGITLEPGEGLRAAPDDESVAEPE
jgi:hypothetical protein